MLVWYILGVFSWAGDRAGFVYTTKNYFWLCLLIQALPATPLVKFEKGMQSKMMGEVSPEAIFSVNHTQLS